MSQPIFKKKYYPFDIALFKNTFNKDGNIYTLYSTCITLTRKGKNGEFENQKIFCNIDDLHKINHLIPELVDFYLKNKEASKKNTQPESEIKDDFDDELPPY